MYVIGCHIILYFSSPKGDKPKYPFTFGNKEVSANNTQLKKTMYKLALKYE